MITFPKRFLAALTLATLLASPAFAGDTPPATQPHKNRELAKLPVPLQSSAHMQNSPQDQLDLEWSHSRLENGHYVAYVRLVWGDLDNLIKHGGKQYYSNWSGSLTVSNATASVDKKIQFDDSLKHEKAVAKHPSAQSDKRPRNPKAAVPHEGSGRDELLVTSGPVISWEAGVVGALDGLVIKITSPTPTITATIKAGKFSQTANISLVSAVTNK